MKFVAPPPFLVPKTMTLEQEAERLAELLVGKTVARAWRHRDSEVALEFTDGTRLFVNSLGWAGALELSVTGGEGADED